MEHPLKESRYKTKWLREKSIQTRRWVYCDSKIKVTDIKGKDFKINKFRKTMM